MVTPDADEEQELVPIWFICWALIVAGTLLVPDSLLVHVVDWLYGDAIKALEATQPNPSQHDVRQDMVLSFRIIGLVFALMYLVIRFLLRRSIREAERVERGLPT